MFSVSETEIQPDFVEEDLKKVKEPEKKEKVRKQLEKEPEKLPEFVSSDEEKSTKRDAEVRKRTERKKKGKEIQKDTHDDQKVDEPSTSYGTRGNRRNNVNKKPEEKRETKPKRAAKNKKKTTRRKVAADQESDSTESDFEISETDAPIHDTIQTAESGSENRNEKKVNDVPDDIFDAATQKVSIPPSETDESFIAPTQKNSNDELFELPTQRKNCDDIFEIQTQKVSIPPSETDDSFVAPTQENSNDEIFDMPTQKKNQDDIFEMQTQKVSIPSSETDDSFVAPTQSNKNDDIFEMQTQKVSILPSETDESFIAPTQKNKVDENIFEMCTQKVTTGQSDEDETSVTASHKEHRSGVEDIFEIATQQVRPKKTPACVNISSDEDVFGAVGSKVEDIKKRAPKTHQRKVKNAHKQTKRSKSESESSCFSDNGDKKDDKKICEKKPRGRGNQVGANNLRTVSRPTRSESESSHFCEDDEIMQKEIKTGNKKGKEVDTVIAKNNQRLAKTAARRDKSESESSHFSEDDLKVEKKMPPRGRRGVNTKESQDRAKEEGTRQKETTVIAESSENKPDEPKSDDKPTKRGKAAPKTPVKRENTRARKRNPKYEDTPTKVESSKDQKIMNKSRKNVGGEIEGNAENELVVDKTINENNSNVANLEENVNPVRGARGRKRTTKDVGELTVEKVVNSASSNTPVKATPKKNEKPTVDTPVKGKSYNMYVKFSGRLLLIILVVTVDVCKLLRHWTPGS